MSENGQKQCEGCTAPPAKAVSEPKKSEAIPETHVPAEEVRSRFVWYPGDIVIED